MALLTEWSSCAGKEWQCQDLGSGVHQKIRRAFAWKTDAVVRSTDVLPSSLLRGVQSQSYVCVARLHRRNLKQVRIT